MNNKQTLYEIQISHNGESYLLTKQTHSPFVKSDVFALADYKRTMITLLGTDGMVLQSGKVFFDCEIDENTQVVKNGANPFHITKDFVDFTQKIVPEKTFWYKIKEFFKKTPELDEIFPSNSFICLQNGEEYHFIGALCEDAHTVSFDVLASEKQAVCKFSSTDLPCPHDDLLFDIIEIQGSKQFIVETFYDLIEKLYKKTPKSSPELNVVACDIQDCQNAETAKMLSSFDDYMLLMIGGEKDGYSISSYIQQSELAIRTVLKHSSEKILPIAVISPFLIDKNSVEFELFSGDILKNKNGKPVVIMKNGKPLFLFDVHSKSCAGYLKRQADILFSMGYCGIVFSDLELIGNHTKPGKSKGDTLKVAYSVLQQIVCDKFAIAKGAYQNIATGKFDYFICAEDIAKVSSQDSNQSHTNWDFSGFETLISTYDFNSKFPCVLPAAVPSALLDFDPLLFDLCTASNMFACKCFNIINPTSDSLARALQFDFLKEAVVLDIINIETSRYAIVFDYENATNVCFFNFTKSEWDIDETIIPPLSFSFKE